MTSQARIPGPGPLSCPPTAPSLILPAFPGAALLVTSADAPGSKLIIKLKRDGPVAGGTDEVPRTQTVFLTGMPLGWAAPRRDGPSGSSIHTVLVTKAVEDLGGRKPRGPETLLPARAAPPSDASFACTSKGVYENYRRWQRYKALARRHFPATPDAEALACFFIPVLRSLARLRPDMTLEDGVPRAVQEWEYSSNFERMIFYEMAEKFMEFEAEEEQQIQKMKLLASCPQFQPPVPKSTKLTPSPVPESNQQQVYIPKKSASKSRQPRRRQRRPPSHSNPGAPREIPVEAVHQYAEIMEGLETSWEEEEDEKKEEGGYGDPREQEEGIFPDPSLLQYIDQLCGDEEFVCKAEAVIHPQFVAHLLSPEKSHDPLDLVEDLEEELNLTLNQLVEKRLLTLSEEEREPSVCPTSHSDSTPSQSEEEDEVSNSGKGKETSFKVTKGTSLNKGTRTSQLEKPGLATSPVLVPFSHHPVGKRDFPPKAVRLSLSSSPHKCGSHDAQEERLLPALKNTQNLQRQNQVRLNPGQAKGIPPIVSPDITENNSPTGNKRSHDDMTGQGIQRPYRTGSGRKDGRQEKVKGQNEIQRAPEEVSHVVKAHSNEETQPVWQTLDPAHNACGKQGLVQQGGIKHTPQQNLSGPGEQRVNVQSQEQVIRGYEYPSSRTELDDQAAGLKSQWDNQLKPPVQLGCKNQDGCQQEVLRDHTPFLASRKGLNSALNACQPCCGNTACSDRSLAGQECQTSVLSGSQKQPGGKEAKVRLRKKPQNGRECAPVKIRSTSGKALRGCADNLARLVSAEQDGRRPPCIPVLENNQHVIHPVFTPSVEISGHKRNPLASSDSLEVRVLQVQLLGISTEHQSSSKSSGLESSSSPSIQKDPVNTEKFPKTQWPFSDQEEVTSGVDNQLGTRQTLNPSDGDAEVEADGDSCGPSGDHTSVTASPSKRARLRSPQCNDFDENDEPNQRPKCFTLSSSEVQIKDAGSGSEMRDPGQGVERQDWLDPPIKAGATLLELSGGNVEGSQNHGDQEEKQAEEKDEEDEELSSFSSLLASKLSLSHHRYHMPDPKERGEDVVPSLLTKTDRPVSKTRHAVQTQVPQDPIVVLNKSPTTHRSHKRKNNLGTRRSKRLRQQ